VTAGPPRMGLGAGSGISWSLGGRAQWAGLVYEPNFGAVGIQNMQKHGYL